MNFRTDVFDDYCFHQNFTKRAFDLAISPAKPIAITDLRLKGDQPPDFCGYPNLDPQTLKTNWAPYIPRKVSEITFGADTRFFFTAELSGCSLAISDQRPHVVLHIPPEKRLHVTNNYLTDSYPDLTFRFLTPEKDYCPQNNKLTVVIGIKNTLNQKWRFFRQCYVYTEFSSPNYKGYMQSGFDFVRLSALDEF